MAEYDKVSKMAMELIYGTKEQKKEQAQILMLTNIDELENILEVSREVVFDNSGDDRLSFATNCLIDFIYLRIVMKGMKGSYIRNAH